MNQSRLVFVYAGDSGVINSLLHVAHKIISPKTYPCNLCGLMYNVVTEKAEWTHFMKEIDRPTAFLHRDEFEIKFPALKIDLPAVIEDRSGSPLVLVRAEEINSCKTTTELISLIRSRTISVKASVAKIGV